MSMSSTSTWSAACAAWVSMRRFFSSYSLVRFDSLECNSFEALQALLNLWAFEMWGGMNWGSPLPGDHLWFVGQLRAQALGVGLFYRVWIHAHASVCVRKPLLVMLHRAESQGIFSRSWLVREFTSGGGRSEGQVSSLGPTASCFTFSFLAEPEKNT